MAQISTTPFAPKTVTTGASSGVATDALVERLFGAAIDSLEVASVHIGGRLGFYRSLADDGSATSAELLPHVRAPRTRVRGTLPSQLVHGPARVVSARPRAERHHRTRRRRAGLPRAPRTGC